jgi:DTW domain-containing protein YfiP
VGSYETGPFALSFSSLPFANSWFVHLSASCLLRVRALWTLYLLPRSLFETTHLGRRLFARHFASGHARLDRQSSKFMSREMCYRCFWPKPMCWCASITPISTHTKFVFLMHPYEFKRVKAATGRLTHLCLADSAIHMGIGFDDHETVQALIHDPKNFPVMLYPTKGARDLSKGELHAADFEGRRLVVFLLDATWRLVRTMWRASPSLHHLPRIMFSNAAPSRYVIKQQPEPGCLSTLEATHELLLALERSGLDQYPLPDQLLGLFQRMQDLQIRCATESVHVGDRRRVLRVRTAGPSTVTPTIAKRRRIFPLDTAESPSIAPTQLSSDPTLTL